MERRVKLDPLKIEKIAAISYRDISIIIWKICQLCSNVSLRTFKEMSTITPFFFIMPDLHLKIAWIEEKWFTITIWLDSEEDFSEVRHLSKLEGRKKLSYQLLPGY
jgi:hypothetical protein